jgi:hypothetical protein
MILLKKILENIQQNATLMHNNIIYNQFKDISMSQ